MLSSLSKVRVKGVPAAASSGRRIEAGRGGADGRLDRQSAPAAAGRRGLAAPPTPDGAGAGARRARTGREAPPDGSPEARARRHRRVADAAGAYVQPGGGARRAGGEGDDGEAISRRAGRRRMSSGDLVGGGEREPAGRSPGRRDGTGSRRTLNLPPGRRSCRGGLGHAQPDRDGSRLDPARDPELGEDVADVDADGLLADEQALADLAVRPALGDQGEHLALAVGQAEGVAPGDRRLPDDAADDGGLGGRPERAGADPAPAGAGRRSWRAPLPPARAVPGRDGRPSWPGPTATRLGSGPSPRPASQSAAAGRSAASRSAATDSGRRIIARPASWRISRRRGRADS